jgi:glycosyltransferase involved in cell wall biosynthesis
MKNILSGAPDVQSNHPEVDPSGDDCKSGNEGIVHSDRQIALSVVMPCYKGERFIENSIRVVNSELLSFGQAFEIVVVVDGFLDRTFERAKALEPEHTSLNVVGYEENRGKGYAIAFGARRCRGKYVAALDSDLDYHPRALSGFFTIAEESGADLVIGNRRDPGSTYRYPWIRKLFSMGFNVYVNILFPKLKIWDTQAGIKLIRRPAASVIFETLETSAGTHGYVVDIYILMIARSKNFCIVQAPCNFNMQESSIGTGGKFLTVAWKMGRDVLKAKGEIQRMTKCTN